MSTPNHTPSPWKWRWIDIGGLGRNYKYLARGDVARLPQDSVISVIDGYSLSISDADAKLIESAPELLEFAMWAVDQLQGDSGTGDSHWEQFPEYVAGLDAIAKATGHAGTKGIE